MQEPNVVHITGAGSRPGEINRAGPQRSGGAEVASYPFRFRHEELFLDPIIHLRYRMWQSQADYRGTFAEFLDECTEIVTGLMELVPPGYELAEE